MTFPRAGNEKTPLTDVRGEKSFHGTTLICPTRDISSHPVTEVGRSAPRGLLRSGCFPALAGGLHLSPLAEGLFRKADFFTAFYSLYYTSPVGFVKAGFSAFSPSGE